MTLYLQYKPLVRRLQALQAAHPDLCRLISIGVSPEGREIWALVLSRGDDRKKPAILVDANTHAGEVTGSAAALHLAEQALAGYSTDARWRDVLSTRALYVVPRLSVDGAETYLTTPHRLRSVARPYPEAAEPDGFQSADVDGDGRILTMLIPSPLGEYKKSELDGRVLVRRRPSEVEGAFYRVVREGVMREAGALARPGVPIREGRPRWGLDFNRNYPAYWEPEGRQPGAGRMPLSEPETRALADFVVGHPGIGLYVSLHTTGGIVLRPPSHGPDSTMDPGDLATFRNLGWLGPNCMGYPCASTFETFNQAADGTVVKGADDWMYEHYGIAAFTIELWDLCGRAGVKGYAQRTQQGIEARSFEEEERDGIAVMRFVAEALGGEGFFPWRPFEHPQFGPVELGGYAPKFLLQNPPPKLLPEECEKTARFVRALSLTTPRLTFGRIGAEPLGSGRYRLFATVQNEGYLATSVTHQAVRQGAVSGVSLTLSGAERVEGPTRVALGELEGHGHASGHPIGTHRMEAEASWVIEGAPGDRIGLEASHPRAGTVAAWVDLTERPPA